MSENIDDLIKELDRVKSLFVKKQAEQKVCHKCGEKKPLREFSRQASCRGGYSTFCKACKSKQAREWAEKNPERKKQMNLAYQQKVKAQTRTLAQKEFYAAKKDFQTDLLGGFKASILNYTKRGEFRFNIVRTDGKVFKTNNKQEFLDFLEKRI